MSQGTLFIILDKSSSKLSGTGQTTGNLYKFTIQNLFMLTRASPGARVLTDRVTGRIVSLAGGPIEIVDFLMHFTVNANGEVTVKFSFLGASCM